LALQVTVAIEKWSNIVILGLLPIFLAILGLNMEPVVKKTLLK
jgi:hypothetical protein